MDVSELLTGFGNEVEFNDLRRNIKAADCRLVLRRRGRGEIQAADSANSDRVALMILMNAAISAVLQVLLLGGIPFFVYAIYQNRRHERTFREIARRAGLQLGETRYLLYSLAFVIVGVVVLLIWSPPLAPLIRQGSAQRQFVGLGFSMTAVTLAILNGAIQTAFAEELLFRGLLAGSLSRRLSLPWANILQAFIFFLPHLAILLFAPEVWGILPAVFLAALVLGWLRIKSGSILGGWMMHASGNVTMALIVAVRTSR